MQSFAVGFVVPDQETLLPWAQKNDVSATFEDLCKNEVCWNQQIKFGDPRSKHDCIWQLLLSYQNYVNVEE